jgi:acyl-CoA synthetase (AMP-forming)/AMP-acid ligase II
MTVFDALSQAAREWPRRTAVMDAAGVLDYRSLWCEIEDLRAQLARLGVREGQGVGVRARNGRAFVIGALAASGCGALVMPIHHQVKPGELTDMMARAPLNTILESGCGDHARLEQSVTLQTRGGTGFRFTRLEGARPSLPPEFQGAAFMRFTSGTTGAAKGVVLTHQAVVERIEAANAGLGLTCEDRVLWVLPMAYHFFVSILLYLQAGAGIIIGSDYLAESILESVARHQATFLYLTPMHVRLLTAEASGRPLPPSVRRVMSVSSRLDLKMANDFLARFRLPVAQGYGIIEVGLPIVNIHEAREHPEAIGRPLPAFQAAIMDDAIQPVPKGQTGQLAIRGPGMFAGYLSPPQPRTTVLRQGWFITGDLAHLDPVGRIILDGRASSVIQTAGHKVFPEEVAAVLDQHPAVLRSRVTGRSHPELGEAVHAEVQVRNGYSAPTSEELLEFCRRQLSDHKAPISLDFVAELELTPSGKVRHGSA